MRECAGYLVEKSRGESLRRLWPAHDRYGSWPRWSGRYGRSGERGRGEFQAFHGVSERLMVDDATIFRALSRTATNGALICMHAENGSVIDVIVQKALAEGKTAPIYHGFTRPTTAEAEAVNRSIAMAEMAGVPVYIVHLSSDDALNKVREGARSWIAGFRGDLPAVFVAIDRRKWSGRISKARSTCSRRRCEREEKSWEALGRAQARSSCRWCRRIIAHSVSKIRKCLAKTTSPRFPNGGPGIENRFAVDLSPRRE